MNNLLLHLLNWMYNKFSVWHFVDTILIDDVDYDFAVFFSLLVVVVVVAIV